MEIRAEKKTNNRRGGSEGNGLAFCNARGQATQTPERS